MSTQESPFYLLYGRNPRLPAAEVLAAPDDRRTVDLRDYKTELCHQFTEAWKLAQSEIQKSQKSQKEYFDRKATPVKVHVGDRVFAYIPAEKTGKTYKFACPYKGTYRVLKLYDNGAQVKLVSKPNSQSIRVALNRVHLCPAEIVDVENDKSNVAEMEHVDQPKRHCDTENPVSPDSPEREDPWSRRLRPRDKTDHCGR